MRMECRLSLYVAGNVPNSQRATENINNVCKSHPGGKIALKVIDILANPQAAYENKIIAVPTLVREHPLPVCKTIGDLSDQEQLLRILNPILELKHAGQ
jgi:circadian clock protein KaiB